MAMSEDPIHHPHDKLFKAGFSRSENAAAFLREEVPAAVAEAVDWSRLHLEPGSFIDSHLRGFASDLLFSAPIGDADCLVYILFEHQTREEPMLALRLLRYMVRIWETWLQNHSQGRGARLPVIVPVVLAQDSKLWSLTPDFACLFDVPAGQEGNLAPFVPGFSFQLIELAGLPFEAIRGTPAGIMILRTMKAERTADLFADPVWDEALLVQVPEEIFELLVRYILGADVDKERFRTRVNSLLEVDLQTKAMTIADQLRAEGRQEGRQEGGEALARAVVSALEVRFGKVPEDLRASIKTMRDLDRLERLLRVAIEVESIEDFRRGVGGG
jgi:predicted transposase/invertase (TIGR01784 family)